MGTGTDVAIESAGIALVEGDLRGIVRARRLSRATLPQHPPEPLPGLRATTCSPFPVAAGAALSLHRLAPLPHDRGRGHEPELRLRHRQRAPPASGRLVNAQPRRGPRRRRPQRPARPRPPSRVPDRRLERGGRCGRGDGRAPRGQRRPPGLRHRQLRGDGFRARPPLAAARGIAPHGRGASRRHRPPGAKAGRGVALRPRRLGGPDAVHTLWAQERPSPTLVGIVLTLVSMAVMRWLAAAKRSAAKRPPQPRAGIGRRPDPHLLLALRHRPRRYRPQPAVRLVVGRPPGRARHDGVPAARSDARPGGGRPAAAEPAKRC